MGIKLYPYPAHASTVPTVPVGKISILKWKYHMVRWATVRNSKDMGCVGILNTMLMNVALLSKWI
jgi:hypothetical protein